MYKILVTCLTLFSALPTYTTQENSGMSAAAKVAGGLALSALAGLGYLKGGAWKYQRKQAYMYYEGVLANCMKLQQTLPELTKKLTDYPMHHFVMSHPILKEEVSADSPHIEQQLKLYYEAKEAGILDYSNIRGSVLVDELTNLEREHRWLKDKHNEILANWYMRLWQSKKEKALLQTGGHFLHILYEPTVDDTKKALDEYYICRDPIFKLSAIDYRRNQALHNNDTKTVA